MAFDSSYDKTNIQVEDHEIAHPQTKRARLKASTGDTWDKPPEERRLVQKVDWWLLSYACIAYFIKALDQGNIPSQLVLTKIRPSIWLPTLEFLWSCLVMALAGAKNRAAIFQASSSAAHMFSRYLQAALYSGMNSRAGLAAWQWLFIFDGILGIPISLMKAVGRAPAKKILTLITFVDDFRSWPVWFFSTVFIAHVLGLRIYSYSKFWLKSTGDYTTEQVNVTPSAGYGLQIICTLLYAWTSDFIRLWWPVIVFACIPAITGTAILSVWPETNTAAMMTGWLLMYAETGAGILFTSWVSEIPHFSIGYQMVYSITFSSNCLVCMLCDEKMLIDYNSTFNLESIPYTKEMAFL
ncbi:hypothetical protein BDW62DRAFT_212716 [Aspergillus aurantiobrunneus]